MSRNDKKRNAHDLDCWDRLGDAKEPVAQYLMMAHGFSNWFDNIRLVFSGAVLLLLAYLADRKSKGLSNRPLVPAFPCSYF